MAHTTLPRLVVIISAVFMLAGAIGMIDILLFVKVAEPPTQITCEFTLTLGNGLTVTVPEPLLAQPVVPSVTITV